MIVEITGVIRPLQRAQLAAKLMGTIDEIPVVLGQRVRAGDLLVKISAAEIAARVAQAEAQFNAVRRERDRERGLLNQGASAAETVRELEDRFVSVQAAVREAQTLLGYTEIRAPFDGVVARRLVNPGDLASPGLPLLEVEGTSDFRVEADVPESIAATTRIGALADVEIPTTRTTFRGEVAELSSAADSSAHTVFAKIVVPATAGVRSGDFARVRLSGSQAQALLAPVSAVSQTGQMERVFVATADHRAVLRLVKTGALHGERIEILAGLDDGDRVIVQAPRGLRETEPIEVLAD